MSEPPAEQIHESPDDELQRPAVVEQLDHPPQEPEAPGGTRPPRAQHPRGRDWLLERRAARLREHRARGRAQRRGLTRARAAALLALAVVIALAWFLASLFQPFHGSGNGSVIVDIPPKSSTSKVASILAHEGVVSSAFFFELRATIEGKRSELHSGRFQLRRDMSYAAAIEALSKSPPTQIPVRVLIPEGENRLQIAQLARADGLSGDYLAASKRSPLLHPARYGAPRGTPNLEGFLFPATYDMVAGESVRRLVAEQLTAFRENFTSREIARARALHVTPYELLVVASMIEREAQTAGDRPKISAVIYNRLRAGMPLGIDATTYYGIEVERHIPVYTHELTEADLHSSSPYNTRTRRGLPPTPISNPGAASIQAAAHPARVSYLYYVLAADGCGEHSFSSTAAGFARDAASYRRAVEKNGGKPPLCKRK